MLTKESLQPYLYKILIFFKKHYKQNTKLLINKQVFIKTATYGIYWEYNKMGQLYHDS